MTNKPARKPYKKRHPSQLKVTRSVAMKSEHWDKLDKLRGDRARGVYIVEQLNKKKP